MHAGIPALGPAYMQAPGGEVDVVPAQCHQLRGPEAVAVSDQDRRGVPMPRAVLERTVGNVNQKTFKLQYRCKNPPAIECAPIGHAPAFK
jgi:hypothetical protein